MHSGRIGIHATKPLLTYVYQCLNHFRRACYRRLECQYKGTRAKLILVLYDIKEMMKHFHEWQTIYTYVHTSLIWFYLDMSQLLLLWYSWSTSKYIVVLFNLLHVWVASVMRPTASPMMTSSNGNIFRVTGPLWGEFTGHRWIPLTKASDVELWCFLWSALEQTVE